MNLEPGHIRSGVKLGGRVEVPPERPELILYISSGSSASFRGVQNLLRALAKLAKSEYALRIIDLSREPLDGSRPDDKIMFTPTLVRRSPAPRAWLMGDLSDSRALESFLL